jgi:hypothetical protein
VTLASVLQNFSVAQVYNLIWRAERDAAAFYQRGGVTRPQAAEPFSALRTGLGRSGATFWTGSRACPFQRGNSKRALLDQFGDLPLGEVLGKLDPDARARLLQALSDGTAAGRDEPDSGSKRGAE